MNEVIENILSRRSIRKYLNEQITDEDLSTILEVAKHAPSGGNSQTWHFTVLQNKEKLRDLNKYVRAAFEKLEVDENTYKSIRSGKVAAKNEAYRFYYNAPTLIIVSNERDYGNAMADSACAIENMLLASNALNLGSCYVNQLTWFGDDKDLRKLLIELGVPENHKVCGAIIVGYRDGGMPTAANRRENAVTIVR
ncbi:nitroreductase family protein [Clostridium sp. 'White wine YQ']|uniref:nitroreductase family protein n=1 Tax=Clostridium sp. 'White wine YQ' TaxID=3027474 RepID=UPI002367238A|nr:nitroreductase family protein [Clostridium sp. 'White wine YQ']MDD7794070.1 nitroreductase family protein [Clostridium sp. 'White wine YQ']